MATFTVNVFQTKHELDSQERALETTQMLKFHELRNTSGLK